MMYRDATCASLWVDGPLPGMNEMIAAAKGFRGRGIAYANMKREWTAKVAAVCLNTQIDKPGPFQRRVILDFEWVEPTKRRDPDNIAAARKFILDGLVMAKVLHGDGWQFVDSWHDRWTVNADRPGVGVTIRLPGPTVQMGDAPEAVGVTDTTGQVASPSR